MRNSKGETIGAIAVILFMLGTLAVSIGVTVALYYALFHFIVKFW